MRTLTGSPRHTITRSTKNNVLALKRGDNVIVTRKKGGYAIAIVESLDTVNPDMADIITEHVCCKIMDEFYTEGKE